MSCEWIIAMIQCDSTTLIVMETESAIVGATSMKLGCSRSGRKAVATENPAATNAHRFSSTTVGPQRGNHS